MIFAEGSVSRTVNLLPFTRGGNVVGLEILEASKRMANPMSVEYAITRRAGRMVSDLPYRTIHNMSVQASRHDRPIFCGPGGTCHDYVPFYFGPLSVMLLNLKTGRVAGYTEGQAPLIYLTTTVARVRDAGCRFVFSDGHGLAAFTEWYDDLAQLDQVDWNLVGARYWADQPDDNDRKRRKQAEFLIWKLLDWSLIEGIGVLNQQVKVRVEALLDQHPDRWRPNVQVKRPWYY